MILTVSCTEDNLIRARKNMPQGFGHQSSVTVSSSNTLVNIRMSASLACWDSGCHRNPMKNWFSTNDYSRSLMNQSNNCIWKWVCGNTCGCDTSIHFKIEKLISFAHWRISMASLIPMYKKAAEVVEISVWVLVVKVQHARVPDAIYNNRNPFRQKSRLFWKKKKKKNK